MTEPVKALTYIEIDIPFCARTYGIAPCTATLSGPNPTGTIKCFNTPKTCQDRANYLDAPVTLRFAQDVGYLDEVDIDCIPSATAISYTPAVVSLGKDLGTRASLSVTFRDHPWPDTPAGFDKYLSERPYNAIEQGTFWGKFRARQPFLRGRAMRLIRGFVGQALGDMETRHFVIDSFSHNAQSGAFTITAKDALKLADDDRAQAPLVSNGFLSADITDTATVLTLQPAGIGNEEYPPTGYAAIGGKEIVHFDRNPDAGADANAKSLLHFTGVPGSTTITDSGSTPKTWGTSGNAELDSSKRKFGLTSLHLFGGVAFVNADHADFTPAGNFTFEMQVLFDTLASTQYFFTHYSNATNRYFLSVSSSGALTFSVINGGSTIVTMSSSNGAVADDDEWHHVAVVRNGNNWRIYVDGISVATTTDSDAIPNFTSSFVLGGDHASANTINGWIDEFRLSHVARWTANFTPPLAAYTSSSDEMLISRAQLSTEASAHEASDRIQVVLSYDAQDAADIIRDLLVTYAGVPDTYIPLDTWKTETASYLNRLFSAHIAEPTGVQKLISEIVEDGALSVWWDDVASLIRLRVLRAVPTSAALFDQAGYLEGSFSSREQPNSRLSQIWRYFAKRNPLEGQDDPNNYRSMAATAELEAETDYGSAVIHKIFSRWIPLGGRSIADKANDLYLSRFRDPPRRFNFSTFRDGVIVPILGQGYRVAGMGIQDETGLATDAPIQITKLRPSDGSFEIEAEEMLVGEPADLINRVITIDAEIFNINLRELHDQLYPAPTDADVIAGVTLKCYVEEGVLVGSSSGVGTPAFIVGSWPVGFLITLIVAGKIQGAGGKGGGQFSPDGQQGGTALYTRFPIDLEVGSGAIWGGGGGGGFGGARVTTGTSFDGSGGGGGAGQLPGSGGAPSTNSSGPDGDPGEPGTLTAGGAGGTGGANGGSGGGPGAAGTAGAGGGAPAVTVPVGAGGAAGSAIDGVSYVTVTVGPGDRLGPEIN